MTAVPVPERLPFRVALAGARFRSGWLSWLAIGLFGIAVLLGLLAPVISPYSPTDIVGPGAAAPGTSGHLLGTDMIGRDVLSRVLYGMGTTISLAIAIVAIGITTGGLVGAIAGTVGGWLDNLLMRITDVFLALPAALVAIAIVGAFGGGSGNLLLGVSLVWWPYFARIVRGEVVSFAARPHVEAARLTGVPMWRIAFRHILPGVVPTLIVLASVDVGAAVLMVASLSFLGLGAAQPSPELGADAAQNIGSLLYAWWIPIIPGIGVLVIVAISNLAGSGVRNLLGK